jgi:hypothetical protein
MAAVGVDEVLEEEDRWLEESGRIFSAGEDTCYRNFISDGKFLGQTIWRIGAARRSGIH